MSEQSIQEKKIINVPFSKEEVIKLKAGEYIYLTGTIYSARDAAHKRMYDSINDAVKKNPAAAQYDGKKLCKEEIGRASCRERV